MDKVFIVLVFLPYVAVGKAFKLAKDYCKKKNWIFLRDVLSIIGFPFSLFDDKIY